MMESEEYHVARLLLLLDAFTKKGGRLDGLTKLAKLDFLLRYPVFLERLMDRRELQWPAGLAPVSAERIAVESRMIRHKYGPWDHRYYSLIGALLGRGLAELAPGKGSISLRVSPLGHEVAGRLAATTEWNGLANRATFLKRTFDMSGNRLKELIYAELPDVVDRPHRTVIELGVTAYESEGPQ
jgi:hypothetical protein